MKNTVKLVCFIIFFQFFASVSSAREVRFIQITDANINRNNAYKLKNTVQEINHFKNIDFVVFGGNNIQKVNPENLNLFMKIAGKVNKKTIILLGSTDVSSSLGLSKETYLKRAKLARKLKHSTKPNYVFKKKNTVFVVMDGSKEYFQSSNGCYTKFELRWLEKTLKQYSNKNVVILQHFPLLPTKTRFSQTQKLEDYYEVLAKYNNVKMIVSGHYNENREEDINSIKHIITENYSKDGAYKIIQADFDKDFIATFLVK